MTEQKSFGATLWDNVKTVVSALIIAGLFRSLLFQPFWIPSGSMKDTLLIGDFLFVNKMAYGYSYASCPSIRIPRLGIDIDAEDFCGFTKGENKRLWGAEPEIGDVVVFRHPVTGRDFIKRLVGREGDEIQFKDGVMYINGTAVELAEAPKFVEEYAPQGRFGNKPACENGTVGFGAMCEKSKQIETLPNGHSHAILNIRNSPADNTGIYAVPDGHYFFVGDNRDNSTDSRFPQTAGGVGFVPYEDLIGRADRVVFSSAGSRMLFFWTWRSDRFFKAID